ncbi:caspase family protein [Runella sp.]|uniref:caspase family protein n=1 Tax=Runella sp. TaxID=1960881 RepID=UPI003D0BF663
MRNLLFLLFFVGNSFISCAQTLHLILASDYENKDFGMISLKDEEMVGTMFNKIGSQIGYNVQTVYINKNTKDGFTGSAVRNAINDTSIHSTDIVIFYYSGFGTYSAKSTLPSLQLNNNSLLSFDKYTLLPLDDVAGALQAKGIRLGMVMADCRDKITTRYPTPIPRNTIVKEDQTKEILKKLFLGESCRILKIASAQKGKPAFAIQRNSVFTYSLTEAFEDMLYVKNLKEVSLDNLLVRINKITKAFIPEYTGLSKVPISCRVAPPRPAARAAR